MWFDKRWLELLADAVDRLNEATERLPGFERAFVADEARPVLEELARRLQDNDPYHHPLYLGQMLKPPHPIAALSAMLGMMVNPNNHALDGGRATSRMEQEAIVQLQDLYAWDGGIGHLTSGGTLANLEALWVAHRVHPGRAIAFCENAHYTHERLTRVLRVPQVKLRQDAWGHMDLNHLATALRSEDIGTVVVTLGTTGYGTLDPLPEIQDLQRQFGFRIHADAAYGGYYGLAANLTSAGARAFAALGAVDSLCVDPHKHGLQPYGCGAILFRDPSVAGFYTHDSPYTYFSSEELHLGEITIECSRPGALAASLWATLQMLPLERGGVFARGLEDCRAAALALHDHVRHTADLLPLLEPELDILCFAPVGRTATEISTRSRALYQRARDLDLHLALIRVPREMAREHWPQVDFDADEVTTLRSCLLKPEHLEWMPEIIDRLGQAMQRLGTQGAA